MEAPSPSSLPTPGRVLSCPSPASFCCSPWPGSLDLLPFKSASLVKPHKRPRCRHELPPGPPSTRHPC